MMSFWHIYKTLRVIDSSVNEKLADNSKIQRGARKSATLDEKAVARPANVTYQRKPTVAPDSENKQGATPKQGT